MVRPLTPPVAPRVRPLKGVRRAPEPTSPPSRQRERFPRSEAPSIDKCSPTRSRGGSPPPIPRLCRRGSASDALSLLDMLSHGGARPSTVVTGYSPVVAKTARRLPISAIKTNCEHNRSIDRAPHTAPESPPAQLSLRVAESPFGDQPAEISRARDRRGYPCAASSHRDRSRYKLHPTPLGSGTSCRMPASAGGRRSIRRG
jgi:hypothetical protein